MPEPTVNPNPAASGTPAPAAGATAASTTPNTPPAQTPPAQGTPPAAKTQPAGAPPAEKATVLGDGVQKPEQKTPEQLAQEKSAAKAERQKNMTPEQKAADDAAELAAEKAKEVPADGKYELKAPEGVEVSAEELQGYETKFKELGLNRGQADSLFKEGLALRKAGMEAQMAAINAYRDQLSTENEQKIKNHPDYGGAKFDESKAIAQRALRTFGNPALITKLEQSRYGNDPDFFEFCLKAGRRLGEAGVVQATPDNAPPQTPEQRMFGEAVKQIEQKT